VSKPKVSKLLPISAAEASRILGPLRAGVVPHTGFQHFQVGRSAQIMALANDRETAREGGASIRFVIGPYGSGKSFLLGLDAASAREEKFATSAVDLSPDKRLYDRQGRALALWTEIIANLATRSSPVGGAVTALLDRFAISADEEAETDSITPDAVLKKRMTRLAEMPLGHDFSVVIRAYRRGHDEGDEDLTNHALRWFRGEYTRKSDARADLGVSSIIADDNAWDALKLLAQLTRLSGYSGLVLAVDELVNVFKMTNTQARHSNIEQILRITNDLLQGTGEGLCVRFGGTPESLEHPSKGLYYYEALRSRLAPNQYAGQGRVDTAGPVLRLPNLTASELLVLLRRLRHIHATGDESAYLLPDQALTAFIEACHGCIGDAAFRTPRNTIVEFLHLLDVLKDNPSLDWQDLVKDIPIKPDNGPEEDAPATEATDHGDNGNGLHGFSLNDA